MVFFRKVLQGKMTAICSSQWWDQVIYQSSYFNTSAVQWYPQNIFLLVSRFDVLWHSTPISIIRLISVIILERPNENCQNKIFHGGWTSLRWGEGAAAPCPQAHLGAGLKMCSYRHTPMHMDHMASHTCAYFRASLPTKEVKSSLISK